MAKTKQQIRVLLADDHAIFRDGLRKLLGSDEDIVIVGEAQNGAAGDEVEGERGGRWAVAVLRVEIPTDALRGHPGCGSSHHQQPTTNG